MTTKLPEHIQAQLEMMIAEGMPPHTIAGMLRLDQKVVDAEIERLNTTQKPVAASR